jgi:hypothetical protein
MITTELPHTAHEKIFDLMLRARWLHAFRFTDDRCWRLIWTTGGAQRALLLKAIIRSYDLGNDDHAPVAFTILAQSGNYDNLAGIAHRDVLAFWQQCCDELRLAPTFDDCLALVQILSV